MKSKKAAGAREKDAFLRLIQSRLLDLKSVIEVAVALLGLLALEMGSIAWSQRKIARIMEREYNSKYSVGS